MIIYLSYFCNRQLIIVYIFMMTVFILWWAYRNEKNLAFVFKKLVEIIKNCEKEGF